MKEQKRKRSITVTFLKGFEEEHEHVSKLKEEGINRSFWICQAIREKINREETENNLIEELMKRVNDLEKTVKEQPTNIVYMPTKETEENIDEDLIRAASSFEF